MREGNLLTIDSNKQRYTQHNSIGFIAEQGCYVNNYNSTLSISKILFKEYLLVKEI